VLRYWIEREVDLPACEARFRNDKVGASAYSPAVLFNVVQLAFWQRHHH